MARRADQNALRRHASALEMRVVSFKSAHLFFSMNQRRLDPVSRVAVWEMLKHLKNHGNHMLITTHYMDEPIACATACYCRSRKAGRLDTPMALSQRSGQMSWKYSSCMSP